MAFVNQLSPEEEEKKEMGSNAPAPVAPVMAGSAGVAVSAQPVNKGGSQFADVSRYLTQNQPQGERLASKLGGNVVSAGNQARNVATSQTNALNQAQTGFNQAYQANRPKALDPSILNRVTSSPTSFFNFNTPTAAQGTYTPTQGFVTPIGTRVEVPRQSTVTAPTGAAPVADQSGFDAYEAARNASYKGPTDLGYNVDYSQLNPLASKAGSLAENYKTFSGQQDLLGGLNQPNYSDAAKNLDAVLLGAAPSRSILKNASGQNADIAGKLEALKGLESGAKTDASTKASNAAQEAQGISSQAQLAGQNAYNTFSQDYQTRLTDAQKQAQAIANQYFAGRPDEQSVPFQIPTNVASSEDYNKLQALNQLLGQNYSL